ncbi:hypothetical protein ACSLO3_27045, partial [Escherichia coli]
PYTINSINHVRITGIHILRYVIRRHEVIHHRYTALRVNLANTIQDPLAAKLRERLKSDFGVVKNSKGKLGVDCVFSTEALVYP